MPIQSHGLTKVHPFTIVSGDDKQLALTVSNLDHRPLDLPSGTKIAAVSFAYVAEMSVVKEIHPEKSPPLYDFEEKLWADRRAVRVAQEEALLLGYGEGVPVSWPPAHSSFSRATSPETASSSAPSTPSPLPAGIKMEQLPWNYSWGLGFTII